MLCTEYGPNGWIILLLLHLYAAQICGVASLAVGVVVLLVRAEIWNLAMVLGIAHRLFAKDTLGYLKSTHERWQTGQPV